MKRAAKSLDPPEILHYRAMANGYPMLHISTPNKGMGEVITACMREVSKAWGLKMRDPLPNDFQLKIIDPTDPIPDPVPPTIH